MSDDSSLHFQLGEIEQVETSLQSRSVGVRMPDPHPLAGQLVTVGANRHNGDTWGGPWHHAPTMAPMSEEDFALYAGAVLALFEAYRERFGA